jgi:hypothetical protein
MEREGQWTRVLAVGAEGFMLEVLGEKHNGRWRFRSTEDARTFASFDPDLVGDNLYAASAWMDRWEDVLTLLDREQYWRLSPLSVHPRFANAIQSALTDRHLDREQRTRWGVAISRGRRELRRGPLSRILEELTVDVSSCQSPEQRVVLAHAALPSLQSLLDLLFLRHVQRVAPVHSYGDKWHLINDRNMMPITKSSDRDDRPLSECGVRAGDRLTLDLL